MGLNQGTDLVRFTSPVIDAKLTGASLVATLESPTQKFYPAIVLLEVVGASGVTVLPTVSLGITPAGYTDIFPATQPTGLSNGAYKTFVVGGSVNVTPTAGSGIFVNVSIPATAATCNFRVHVIGFYA